MFRMLIILIPLVYVLWHLWLLPPFPLWGKWLVVIFALLCFAMAVFSLTRYADRIPLSLSSAAYNIGNKSLIILLYLFMLFLLIDILRLLHILPSTFLNSNTTATIAIVLGMAALFSYASIHYRHKTRVAIELNSGGKLQSTQTIVAVSDLHIGYHNRRRELSRWIDLINSENPDIIVIAGDIIDRSLRPIIEEDMAAEFRRLQAPVYACLGNHEYYVSEPLAEKFYHQAGINLLIDSTATIGSLHIIGRDDRSNPNRKSLSELVDTCHADLYTILLDHQPYHLEEAEQNNIDFQFSGHTHRGQVWPLSWITDAIYECSWGEHSRGSTRYYISSGLGIWGAKYRIGTQSEYVVINLQ